MASSPLVWATQTFINKFSSKFEVYDTVAKAERKLVSLRMSIDKCFTVFIIQFEKKAYETGWNYDALRFQLSQALSKHIHNVLQLTPKQLTYKSFKNLVTQINQHHWEDPSALPAMHPHQNVPQPLSMQPQPFFLHPLNPLNVAGMALPPPASACPTQAQDNSWNSLAPCLPAQLQATKAEEIAELCQSGCNSEDCQEHNTEDLDLEEGEECLQANQAQNMGHPWVAVLEKTKEQ
ncbi:hypothetical protein C0995_015945 [Termitomyces sp. Mi166|nr:hypothetical protein C0995_015945 [Termitomyces sp. Mi166\